MRRFWASVRASEAHTSNVASTREAVTLACRPPGPDERLVRRRTSESGIRARAATVMGSSIGLDRTSQSRRFRSLWGALAVVVVATGVAAPVASARVRYVFTVAGNGAAGFGGDGGPATQASLDLPRGVSAVSGGGILIAEADNNTVRLVKPDGTITTVAGDGDERSPATAAPRGTLRSTSPTTSRRCRGGFLIADMNNRRVRRVSRSGVITTVAGNGNPGRRATAARHAAPSSTTRTRSRLCPAAASSSRTPRTTRSAAC